MKTSRTIHLWQANSKLYSAESKAKVESEWIEYKEANPEANQSHQALFKFRNEKMKKWYEEADTKTKKEVEEYREMFLAEPDGGDDSNPNVKFQE